MPSMVITGVPWGIGCEVAKPCVENDARVFGGARRQEDAKRVRTELDVSHVLTLRGFRQRAGLRHRPLRHDPARLAARPRPRRGGGDDLTGAHLGSSGNAVAVRILPRRLIACAVRRCFDLKRIYNQ